MSHPPTLHAKGIEFRHVPRRARFFVHSRGGRRQLPHLPPQKRPARGVVLGHEAAEAEFLARPVRRIYKRGKQKELKSGFDKNLIGPPSSFESALGNAAGNAPTGCF